MGLPIFLWPLGKRIPSNPKVFIIQMTYIITPATHSDIPQMNTLIEESARGLSTSEYTHTQIEGLIEHVFGVDSELIDDGTYYKITQNNIIVACGGWSKRKTLFGSDQCQDRSAPVYLNPQEDPAKIRAFFVSPHHARKGLGSMLLNHCEDNAKTQGFQSFEMMATLPGVKLYQRFEYQALEHVEYVLPNSVMIPLVKMGKTI
jgi:GNAT superfamily N-acetyltransferase